MSESMTLYKLIILYILNKVDFPMTNGQISAFMLEKEYTSYFSIQQAFSEMIDSQLLRVEAIRNTSYYHISDEGEETLTYFGDKISAGIRDDIKTWLTENQYKLRNETAIRADYYRTTNKEYEVHCVVREKHTSLIELKVTVATEEQAVRIADNWTAKHQEIYAHIIDELLLTKE